jgi:anti-sigma regulatory factor (Ser/Thr protein kinase)
MTHDVNSTRVWKLHASLPSVSGLGESRVDAVVEELNARGWSENDQFAARLALTEALENAVEHGNNRVPEKNIELTVVINDSRLFASVSDEGSGSAPKKRPTPLSLRISNKFPAGEFSSSVIL